MEQFKEVEDRNVSIKVSQRDKATKVLTKEFLEDQITNQKKSLLRVAKETGLSNGTVKRAAKKYNVYVKYVPSKHNTKYYNEKITEEFIIREYLEKQRSLEDLAKELEIHPTSLSRRLKKMGFEVRSQIILTEEQKLNLRWEHLTPIKRHVTEKGKRVFDNYIFQCSCGKLASLDWGDVLRGKRENCGKCDWYEDIRYEQWNRIVIGAEKRNLEFNITKEYVWSIYLKQDRKCIFTGFPVKFSIGDAYNASIDRIDNSKGYIEGNIQITHKSINLMRGATECELFKYLCTAVAVHSNVDKSQFENKQLKQVRNTTICE